MSISHHFHRDDKGSLPIYKELYEFLRDRCTRYEDALYLIRELVEAVVAPYRAEYSQLLNESVKAADVSCANMLKMAIIMTTPQDELDKLQEFIADKSQNSGPTVP